MTIKILTPDLYEEYESFLFSQPQSLLYHSMKYKNFLEDLLGCKSYYVLDYHQGQLVAALPLMIKDGRYGAVANSLPYYGSNGGIIGNVSSLDFIDEYKEFVKDCASSTLISSPFYNTLELFQPSTTDQRISQITHLKTDLPAEEYLWGVIDGSTRRNIKKAQKEGVTISIENDQAIPFLEQTHNENMMAMNGKAKNKAFFEKFPRHFSADIDYRIIVARINNQPVAALLVFYYNKTVEYFTPVIVKEFRDKQPLALILWQTMLQAIQDGYYNWNWGGTWLTQEGVYQFKKKWGASERIYDYSTLVRNDEIYHAPSQILQADYDGFYVYNFQRQSTQ